MDPMRDSIDAVGLYVHVPFCTRICHYCDFACYAGQDAQIERYLEAVLAEASAYPRALRVRTLYLGGGTPSVLSPDQLERLVSGLRAHLDLTELEEATLELNPATGGPRLWDEAIALGFNRFSVGVQSFDAELLRRLGRDHDPADVLRTIEDLRAAKVDALSLDLMYGLPGQTLEVWAATIDQALTLQPEHVSVYGLILEDRTAFGRWHKEGRLVLPGEEVELEMGDLLVSRFEAAGYVRYEIGSFARPGFRARHNGLYWSMDPYLGLGPGAHSFWQGRRYENPRGLGAYFSDPAPRYAAAEPLTARQVMEELAFLGLRRTQDGLEREAFHRRTGHGLDEAFPGVVEGLVEAGLVRDFGDKIVLTPRGCWLSNEVFAAFLA